MAGALVFIGDQNTQTPITVSDAFGNYMDRGIIRPDWEVHNLCR